MLKVQPHGEDGTNGARALPVSMSSPNVPPGEDGIARGLGLENAATALAAHPDGVDADPADDIDFLGMVRYAESQAQLYTAQANRKAWSQAYRAVHNEHYIGSKYTRPEWRNRSRLFVPKTRGALRKDMAAVAASLFNNVDAINCKAGDESDSKQRASAAVMEEIINYRTDRQSGAASFPWFLIAMGARQDAVIAGVCLTKQYWKQDYRKTGQEHVVEPGDDGAPIKKIRDVYTMTTDRPDMRLFAPENFIIDPAAPWDNAIQGGSYVVLKYPMTLDEIVEKQNAPVNPWRDDISEATLRGAAISGSRPTMMVSL